MKFYDLRRLEELLEVVKAGEKPDKRLIERCEAVVQREHAILEKRSDRTADFFASRNTNLG